LFGFLRRRKQRIIEAKAAKEAASVDSTPGDPGEVADTENTPEPAADVVVAQSEPQDAVTEQESADDKSVDSPSEDDKAQTSANVRVEPDSLQRTESGECRVIAVANQKGGVGKTTTAVSLASAVAESGHKVLLLDIDPQANATSGIGLDHTSAPGIYEVLVDGLSLTHAVMSTVQEDLLAVPSSIDLAGAEIELVTAMSRETKLKMAVNEVRPFFDYVFIDCPPSLGLLTLNGLTASDELVIPVQCEFYALEGVSKLRETVDLVKTNLNPELEISGVLLTMYDGRAKLTEQVADEVRKSFEGKVFETVINRNVRLSEAPSHGLPINKYQPKSTGAQAYRAVAVELIARG